MADIIHFMKFMLLLCAVQLTLVLSVDEHMKNIKLVNVSFIHNAGIL